MKKLLMFTFTFLFICGFSMAQKLQMSPSPSDGGESVFTNSPKGQMNIAQTDALQAWALPSTGSTSANSRIPRNASARYQREEYLITAAEMATSGYPSANTIDAIGFTIATAGVGAQTGTLNIYLRNTTDVAYSLGSTWTTTGFTQVSTNASWTVPIVVGTYTIPFVGGSPFTYTGGGVYVAWEFSNPAGTLPTTTSLIAYCNTNETTMCYGYQGTTSSTTLTVTAYRPATLFVNNSITDIANITNIYTLEKVPVSYGTPTPINVRVANVSNAAATFNVTLTVKDPTNTTTRFTSTLPVTALAANTATILNFTGWTPTILENANITATTSVIPTETFTVNNTRTIQSSVNSSTFGYDFANAGPSGFGFTFPGTGLFAAKFTMHGTGNVLGANLMISTDAANTGNQIYAVLMSSAGVILDQSASYTILAGDLGVNKYFSFPVSPAITNADYYVALAQTAGTVQWYPMGTYDEIPQRDLTFYTADITGGTLTLLPATFNLKYGIEAVVGAPPSVINPGAFAAIPVSSSEIDLSWTLNGSGNNVLVAWSSTGTFGTPVNGSTYTAGSSIAGGGTVLQYNNLTSFNHTGLTSSTHYYYKAWSYNGSIYSTGTIDDATTFCPSTPGPWTETFEATTFPPTCWESQAGSASWTRSTAASGFGVGTASAFADFYNTSGTVAFALFSMPFTNGTLTAPTLKFDYAYATYATEVDEMDVYYSIDGGANFTLLLAMPGGPTGILNTGGVSTAAFVPTAAQWATRTITLPAGTNMVAFNATSAYGNNLYLDNVRVVQGLSDDVGILSLDTRDVFPAGTVTPVATVMNYGGNTETFTVNMTIGAYTSTKTVTALGTGLTQVVTFDPWTAAIGNYTMTATTTLAADLNAANNTASKAVKVMTLNKQVYGYNAYPGDGTDPEGPTTFNLGSPGTLNSLADQSTMNFIAGGTWANGIWYGAVYNTAAPYDFISINPATGARTVIGDMGRYIGGLSYNPATSTMYAVDATSLYTVNMTTGATTLVGTNTGVSMVNLAINSAGVCYALDVTADNLGSVNLTTGVFTAIGPVGFDAQYAQDMEFDRETGELFMAAQDAVSGWLAWVNTATGATLKIGDFEGGAEITGFAIPYSSNKTLNLTGVILEGLYNGAGSMRQAADESGPHWPAGVADHITVELHSTTAYGLVTSFSDVPLSTTGTATITVPATYSGSYRITVKHRNSIETTTNLAVSFAGSTINQSFASPADVYGGNLGQMIDLYYAIYAGDVNQDGIIDTGDFEGVDNDAFNYASGYLATDANGDGSVDTGDFVSIDNNGFNYIGSVLP
jgi:hypothetical protein